MKIKKGHSPPKWGAPEAHHSKCRIHDEFCGRCYFSISAYNEHRDKDQIYHQMRLDRTKMNEMFDQLEMRLFKLMRVIEKNHWNREDLER